MLMSKGNLVSSMLLSWCNVFIGNVFVLVIEGMLACARCPS